MKYVGNDGAAAIADQGAAVKLVGFAELVLVRNGGETERDLAILSAVPVRGEPPNWNSDATDVNSFG